ncbi:MAG: serine hydrolase [Rhodobiaceae bacterium]|nr:serine hydrolase [Rhodobiaceae bacterium]MCC0050035.1 serine hydrolase [Rhodobiaceae bacterium]
MKQIVFHPSFEMAGRLAKLMQRIRPACDDAGLSENDIGVVLASYAAGADEAEVAAHNGGVAFYPASTVKLGWAAVALERIEAGTLQPHDELDRCLSDMIGISSNAATNYVVDCLTGVTGDTLLEGDDLATALEAQQVVTRRLASFGWPEWERCQIVQKASDEDRYGRHRQFRDELGHNSLTPMGAARLMHECLFVNFFSEQVTSRMRELTSRPVSAKAIAAEPISQVAAFLGGGLAPALPAGSRLHSKAGWSMYTGDDSAQWRRHDLAFVALPDGSGLLAVVFTKGEKAARSETLLPAVGKEIAAVCLPG